MAKIIFVLIILLTSQMLWAQKASWNDIANLKTKFEKANSISKTDVEITAISQNDSILAYLFNYHRAFVIISAHYGMPPIKAFSLENRYEAQQMQVGAIGIMEMVQEDLFPLLGQANGLYADQWKTLIEQGFETSKQEYGPWLSSEYGQVNCKNENNQTVNVTNFYTPNNYAVGCVALTFATVLQYFEWPANPTGSHEYTDNYGTTKGSHSVNYDNQSYKWSSILDKYNGVAATSSERAELGKLAYQAAIGVDMDFESGGSTSNVNRIPQAANNYFRFTGKHIDETATNFWTSVDDDIILGLPVQFSIYTASGSGHAIVGDGLKEVSGVPYYHLNMGWWGSSNGWYNIQGSFNAGGYSIIKGAVVDMMPIAEMLSSSINVEDSTLELSWFTSSKISPQAIELQVKEGIKDWVTVSNSINNPHYTFNYKSTETHLFRVRYNYDGQWIDNAWSKSLSVDIAEEINKNTPTQLVAYPTLCTRFLTLKYNHFAGSVLSITNDQGLKVYEQTFASQVTSTQVKLDLAHLKAGLYILKIKAPNENTTLKFIKI